MTTFCSDCPIASGQIVRRSRVRGTLPVSLEHCVASARNFNPAEQLYLQQWAMSGVDVELRKIEAVHIAVEVIQRQILSL